MFRINLTSKANLTNISKNDWTRDHRRGSLDRHKFDRSERPMQRRDVYFTRRASLISLCGQHENRHVSHAADAIIKIKCPYKSILSANVYQSSLFPFPPTIPPFHPLSRSISVSLSRRRVGVKTRPCPARGTCELTHVRQEWVISSHLVGNKRVDTCLRAPVRFDVIRENAGERKRVICSGNISRLAKAFMYKFESDKI